MNKYPCCSILKKLIPLVIVSIIVFLCYDDAKIEACGFDGCRYLVSSYLAVIEPSFSGSTFMHYIYGYGNNSFFIIRSIIIGLVFAIVVVLYLPQTPSLALSLLIFPGKEAFLFFAVLLLFAKSSVSRNVLIALTICISRPSYALLFGLYYIAKRYKLIFWLFPLLFLLPTLDIPASIEPSSIGFIQEIRDITMGDRMTHSAMRTIIYFLSCLLMPFFLVLRFLFTITSEAQNLDSIFNLVLGLFFVRHARLYYQSNIKCMFLFSCLIGTVFPFVHLRYLYPILFGMLLNNYFKIKTSDNRQLNNLNGVQI